MWWFELKSCFHRLPHRSFLRGLLMSAVTRQTILGPLRSFPPPGFRLIVCSRNRKLALIHILKFKECYCGFVDIGRPEQTPTPLWLVIGGQTLFHLVCPPDKRVSSLDWKNVFGRNIRRNWGNVLILMQVMKESPGWMKIQFWFLVDWWVWVWQLLDFMKLHILKMGNPPSSRWWQVWEHPQLHSSGTPESRSRCTPHLEVWRWVELQTGGTMGRVSLEMKHYTHGMESWRL